MFMVLYLGCTKGWFGGDPNAKGPGALGNVKIIQRSAEHMSQMPLVDRRGWKAYLLRASGCGAWITQTLLPATEPAGGLRIVRGEDFLTGDVGVGADERFVVSFEGSELVRGGGGPRCMTMPVFREEVR